MDKRLLWKTQNTTKCNHYVAATTTKDIRSTTSIYFAIIAVTIKSGPKNSTTKYISKIITHQRYVKNFGTQWWLLWRLTKVSMSPSLTRRIGNKENYGIGKVNVMLRVSDTHTGPDTPHFITVDKKKRQATLTDPAAVSNLDVRSSQERGPMTEPNMFTFDNLFTAEDQQLDVCASALSEVIPVVLKGSDDCLFAIGCPIPLLFHVCVRYACLQVSPRIYTHGIGWHSVCHFKPL
ncbi:uncharacterized protein [Musca autumnalis]|uniref:uncharacterized protein n=1 Tax=Musca autumnalis TaxID=221902 RepID=UPI003CF982EC